MVGEAINSCPVRNCCSGASAGVGKAAYSVAGSKIAATVAPRRCREMKDMAHVPSSAPIASISGAAGWTIGWLAHVSVGFSPGRPVESRASKVAESSRLTT